MRILAALFLLNFILLSVGCGNFNSVYRNFNVDDGTGAMVDIKQRAVIASRRTTTEGTTTTSQTIVCAEPSPDAMSAYAAELAAEVDIPAQVTARLAAAFQESASFVGLRTQSIQLLRDSLYRLCEGYMSGAIDEYQYDTLLRRSQKYMVALLGIEQLTGAIRAPSVTINTQGSAEVARSLPEMKSEIEGIEKETKDLQKKKEAEGVSEEDKKEIQNKIDSLNLDKEALETGIKNARDLVATGSATAIVSDVGLSSQRSDEHILAVSKMVEKIVLKIVNTDDTGQLCWARLNNPTNRPDSPLNAQCVNYIQNINRHQSLLIDAEEKYFSDISKLSTKKRIEKLKEILSKGGIQEKPGIGIKSFEPKNWK